MTRPTILVTGATGKTGRAVVTQLREQDWPVRAVVRTRDARSAELERLGAQVVVADLFDPDQLLDAMRGTARAYYCPPFHPYMIQSAVAFAVAAREAKLESVVGLTQWLASPRHPSLSTRQHWLADQLFALLPGVAHTAVNPGFFAEYPYLFLMKYAALLGVVPMPGDPGSRNAPPSNADIARVSVAALLDPDTHAGKTYRPTGPELLSIEEMVAIMGRVLGRKVRLVSVPMWMFFKAARMDGVSRIELDGMRYYVEEHSRGTFAFNAPTGDVLAVTGRPPEDFETIARRHAALPGARPTVGNKLRALARFMAVPLQPGFDPAGYERALGMPVPANPRYDLDDARWKAEHGSSDAPLPVASHSPQAVTQLQPVPHSGSTRRSSQGIVNPCTRMEKATTP